MKRVCLLFFVLLLSACMSTEQQTAVTTQDWYKVGVIDGQLGHLEKTANELVKVSTLTDSQVLDYRRGYQDGNNEYCQLSNAYILGVTRKMYQGVCDERKDGWKFRENWLNGRHSTASGMM
ncbi:DUF2799 domain-containing protein [Motilimonas sp. KMU-193]|uniref:DUF2799 domain-containing protein n=1 Tax=Motilimonas sp. KMU-193 TaxID=3388668 RepID=UPI00396B12E8